MRAVECETVAPAASAVFSGCLSLGLFFAWTMLGWNAASHAYGVEVAGDAPYQIYLQAAIVVALFVLSLERVRTARRVLFFGAGTSAVLALVGVCTVWLHPEDVLPVSWLLVGAAQGTFMGTWLVRYRSSLLLMLVMLFGASFCAYTLSLLHACGGALATRVLSVALPVAAALLVPVRGRGALASVDAGPDDGGSSLGGSFLLCCFASGVVSFGAPVGIGAGAPVMVATSAACLAFLVLVGLPRLEIPIALLALFTCVLVGTGLIFAQVPTVLADCTYAGYWALFLCALGWFARPGVPLGSCLRFWGVTYLVTMTANVLALVVPDLVGRAVALVLMVCAFAAAFVRTSLARREPLVAVRPPLSGGEGDELVGCLDGLACQAGLTEMEKEVFVLLAKGFPLKSVAVQLSISESTAKYHRHNIYQKMGIASREELIGLVHGR